MCVRLTTEGGGQSHLREQPTQSPHGQGGGAVGHRLARSPLTILVQAGMAPLSFARQISVPGSVDLEQVAGGRFR